MSAVERAPQKDQPVRLSSEDVLGLRLDAPATTPEAQRVAGLLEAMSKAAAGTEPGTPGEAEALWSERRRAA